MARVLVVDANLPRVRTLARRLAADGHEVMYRTSSATLRDDVAALRPQVALFIVPLEDGAAVSLKALRQTRAGRKPTALALGSLSADERRTALDAGFDDVVPHADDPRELEALVRAITAVHAIGRDESERLPPDLQVLQWRLRLATNNARALIDSTRAVAQTSLRLIPGGQKS